MAFTYTIYTCILFLVLVSAKQFEKWLKREGGMSLFYSFLCLAIPSVLIGCRYDVGTDWEEYKWYYETSLNTIHTSTALSFDFSQRIEPLFLLYTHIIASFQVNYQVYFTITAFLMFVCLFLSFKLSPKNLILGVFFFMTSSFLTTLNIMRQYMAICILLLCVPAILEDKKIKSVVGILASTMFHYSNFLSVILLFLRQKVFSILDKKLISLSLICISFLLKHILVKIIAAIVPFMGNEKYINSLDNIDISHEYSSGLGVLYNIFTSIIIVILSDKNDDKYKVLYKAYIIGVIMSNAFANSIFLGRVASCLTILKIFILPPIVFSLFKSKNFVHNILAMVLIVIPVVGFIMAIYSGAAGCSPYQLEF